MSNSSIHQFKRFVRVQVQKSQVQLENLLLLHSDGKREDMGITLYIHHLFDNAAESACGCDFLSDDRNINGELPNMKHWILNRVIDNN
jgi:hypothetical protein